APLPSRPRPPPFPYTTLFRSEVAMQDARPVPGPEDEGCPDADRLLSAPVVEGARHLALLVEGQRALLGEPLQQHVAQEQGPVVRSEEHTSELQSRVDLVCRLL